jgi:hypothetical protein
VLYEYAVEPELASMWHDRQDGRYFLASFDRDRGRMLSRYPKHWKRLVWEAFHGSGEVERKRMEEILARLSEVMVVRQASYDGTRTWLENAEAEHGRSPFRAVLARANPRGIREVLTPSALDGDEPLWTVPTGMPVPRDPTALAAAVAPMLRCASEIIFVDPHFAPTRARYVRAMGAFLEAAFDGRPGRPPTRIEIQASGEIETKHFAAECKARLAMFIPRGSQVRIVQWRQRAGGEKLHNRYILTDIGGVKFGIGLDDPDGHTGQTEDLNRLGQDQHALRWSQYAGPNPAFELEAELVVMGTRKQQGRRGH